MSLNILLKGAIKNTSYTILLSSFGFLVNMASSISSGTKNGVVPELGITNQIAGPTTSLYLVVFGLVHLF